MAIENPSRRQLLRGQFLQSLHSENAKIQGINAIRPPWSINESNFTDKCTRCGDCILVCETQIIVKGDGGFPEIQFDKGECTFCQKCVLVCEQPIFRSLEEEPWAHKVEITTQCLTENRVECRSCQDSCPMNAIRFRLQLGGVAKPILDLESCNGCVCSIVVQARPEKLNQVKEAILAIPTAEIHGEKSDEGKLVVTLESNRQLALADLMDEIKDIPGVIVVSLISNYLDEK